jgi:pimeloyl-ACP methyl ester carboxylesterase
MAPGILSTWLMLGTVFAQEQAPPKALFVVDGAGGFFTCSNAYLRGAATISPDVQVIPHLWSHGFRRYLADQMDQTHALRKGHDLASQITNWKNAHPGGKAWLLGHSAGCHVAIHAAANLPADCLEKTALLVPSCSTKADIQGALRASRLGVHVWYSESDWLVLGIVMKISGCGDDRSTSRAAGRFGFQPVPQNPADIELMRNRLRQYPWQRDHATLGHNGGHYGPYRAPFAQVVVLPILFSETID